MTVINPGSKLKASFDMVNMVSIFFSMFWIPFYLGFKNNLIENITFDRCV